MKPLRCVFKMSNDLPNLIVTMTDKRYYSSIVAVFQIPELEKINATNKTSKLMIYSYSFELTFIQQFLGR